MDFLQRVRTNYFKICVESEKTPNSQGNFKKKCKKRRNIDKIMFEVFIFLFLCLEYLDKRLFLLFFFFFFNLYLFMIVTYREKEIEAET